MSLFLDKQYYEDIKNLHNPITREEAFQLFLKGYSFVPITTMLDTGFYISVYVPWEQDYFYVIPNNFYERENGCESMKHAYFWEEGTIDIDISKKLINFNVFHEYSKEEISELINELGNENSIINVNNEIYFDIPDDYIGFLDFSKKLLNNHKRNQVYYSKDKYLMFIE